MGLSRSHIGILGGTFDPVHCGHLRMALELRELLRLDQLRLIPAGEPPHKPAPDTHSRLRLRMLELALQGEAEIQADGRECCRPGPSYTVDTLGELRAELGSELAISLCVGADAFAQMPSWHNWQQLPGLCHIVVMARPGWRLPAHLGALEQWRDRFTHNSDTLFESSAGGVLFVSLTPLDISATLIRRLIAQGHSARYLLPDCVWDYIRRKQLYHIITQGELARS